MAGSVDQVHKTKKPGQEAAILTSVVLHPIVSVEKKLQVNNFFCVEFIKFYVVFGTYQKSLKLIHRAFQKFVPIFSSLKFHWLFKE